MSDVKQDLWKEAGSRGANSIEVADSLRVTKKGIEEVQTMVLTATVNDVHQKHSFYGR